MTSENSKNWLDFYIDIIREGYSKCNIALPENITEFKKIDAELFFKDNNDGWPRSLNDINSGIYIFSNLYYYVKIRNLWINIYKNSKDPILSSVAKGLIDKGFSILEIPDPPSFKVKGTEYLKTVIKYYLRGHAFGNYLSNEFEAELKLISLIYSNLYGWQEPLKANIQLTVSGESPSKSSFPDVYEWHFDLPYPNLKAFYNPENLTEMHGPFSYIGRSNQYSSDLVALLIAAGMSSLEDVKIFNSCSEFYEKCAIGTLIPKVVADIRKRERAIFDLPKGCIVISDNLGLHRKTAGHKGLEFMRTYLHPIPYPRASFDNLDRLHENN